MNGKTVLAGALVTLVLAGCSDGAGNDQGPALADVGDPGPLPTTQKKEFASSMPALVPMLAPQTPVGSFVVPEGTAHLHVAFDFAPQGDAPLALRIEGPRGPVLEESPAAGKFIAVLYSIQGGDHRVFAESEAAWTILLVATAFPEGFEDGHAIFVASPQQTQIEHAFHPDAISAKAGKPLRFVLYDYDPHAGTSNLQHNLHFPDLGFRTEGKTTWGEVRVLDLPPLPAGTYGFECEFHGFTGELTAAE